MPEKKKRGRPKTSVAQKLSLIQFDLQKIETMAQQGLSEVMIASILGVDERTLTNWKADPRFVSTLKKGKAISDAEVIKSLYQRAIGYDREVQKVTKDGDVVTYTKHFPSEVLAQIYWLNNRQKEDWKQRQDITSNGETISYTVTFGNEQKD